MTISPAPRSDRRPFASTRDFSLLFFLAAVELLLGNVSVAFAGQGGRTNVLMIIVDDLRAMDFTGDGHGVLGPTPVTPNIGDFARRSTVYTHAFATVPVCGASRASMMTGLRPTPTRLTAYNSRADTDAAGVRTLPDEAYYDGGSAAAVIADLQTHQQPQGSKPFFFCVGFVKPHLPFVAPKRYWDRYEREQIHLARPKRGSPKIPSVALHESPELRNFYGVPDGRFRRSV